MWNRALRSACLAVAVLAGSSYAAGAAVYCKYVGVPKGCVAKAGVVLVPEPTAVVVTPAVRPAPVRRGANVGGPVNRVGVR